MKDYKQNYRIRIGIFSVIIIFAITLFIINSFLINQLKDELNKQVKTIANIYHEKLTNDNVDSQYLIETLLPLIDELDIPMVISTKKSDGTYNYQNLNISITQSNDSDIYKYNIEKLVKRMDSSNTPLNVIEVNGFPIIQIHYGDSVLIENIRWVPYVEFGFAIIVVLFMIIGFNLIWSNEKKYVYVGMAKETAHQLGTPISSLLGWIELLENNSKDKIKIYKSMKRDISKLENISDKFHKIGTIPKFTEINVESLLSDVIDYYRSKLPKSSDITILLNSDSTNNIFIKGDRVLLYWAFENIIKNSIDSIKGRTGIIDIRYKTNSNYLKILFIDSGPGISRNNKKSIFKPGFSTKSKGWGIGLNLSRRIIKYIHKGNIKLIKSKPGETIFEVILYFSVS
tara:strand:- start:187 stop:1383 length:1197 start_codon:yes stop_codon:yes gene_type:complete